MTWLFLIIWMMMVPVLVILFFGIFILPVKFLDFTATPKLNEVSLKWITKEEKGLLYYEVERSRDAINYSFIQNVAPGNLIEQNNYHISDTKPLNGWNYYRLKIVETNGKISYSVVIKAWIGGTKQLLLYPNPAQKEIKILTDQQTFVQKFSKQ